MSSKAPVIIKADSPVSDVKGIGPKKAAAFEKLGIFKIRDAAQHFPRAYEDLRSAKSIASLQNDDKCLVRARVLLVKPGRGFGRKRTLTLLVEDATGRMQVVFFSAGFMLKSFVRGEEYRFFGKVKVEDGRVTIFHPTWAKEDENAETGIVPVYPLAYGLTQKDLKHLTRLSLKCLEGSSDTLPAKVIADANLCSRHYALSNIHYPEGEKQYQEARYRLIFEELFVFSLAVKLSKDRFGSGRAGRRIESSGGKDFIESLSYRLTGAQQRVYKEILGDMASETAMNRLLQGDVGSGKTVIAEAALAQAAKAGYQGAFMAPTELLARQHFETLGKDLAPLGYRITLLIGSQTAAERRTALAAIASGETDIVVGTHAVISESVKFKDLALVITDEQHRFGVNQRKLLTEKGENPDVLVMTATPIPRTLAVVLYGDLDVSVIDELPPGRQPIETKSYGEKERKNAYKLLLSEVAKGRQAYIVAPFIDDSDTLEGHSAESLYEDFCAAHPDITAALLHSGVPAKEKDSVMEAFYKGEISVLISTVVIEVGINVPNATVMLIENSERFGLAQLHQLRGRVGRGSEQSYCLLVSGEESEVSKERSDTMCTTSDGFEIAEKDLEMRGPGEIFGFRQHGLPQLKLADPAKHMNIAVKAGEEASKLLAEDPKFEDPENSLLAERIKAEFLKNDALTL